MFSLVPILSLLVLVLTVVPLLPTAVSTSSSSRVSSSLLVLYTFNEGQSNLSAATTADVSVSSPSASLLSSLLVLPLSATWSPLRQGLTLTGQSPPTTAGVSSANSVSGLVSQLYSSYTVELWFAAADYAHSGTILGFGSWNPLVPSASCMGSQSGAQGTRDWQLYQQGMGVSTVLSYQGSSPGCTTVTVALNASSPYHHVVTSVTRTSSTQATVVGYYNGVAALTSMVTQTPFSEWVQGNHLQLSSSRTASSSPPSSNSTWTGSVYLIAMYSTALSASAVQANYAAGLPNSQPVLNTSSQTVSVVQNASIAVLPLDLTATDFDGDTLLMRVLAVPAIGALWLVNAGLNDSVALTSDLLPYVVGLGVGWTFAYTPAPGTWGAGYGVVQWTAWDSVAQSTVGTITINVQHIVTPPVAVNATVSVLSGQTVTVALVGVDDDPQPPLHSNMSSITLLTLPHSGLLYAYNATASAFATLPLSAPSLPVNLTSALTVLYRPTSPLTSATARSYNDSFTFTVTTKNTTALHSATVTLTVTNPLVALPVAVALTSDTPASLTLRGSSATYSSFSYTITTPPVKGNLTLPGSTAPLAPLFASPSIAYTPSVSVYAGRYNRSLDPVSDAFAYTIIDPLGNTAAIAQVVLTYPLIHHSPTLSLPSAANTTVVVYDSAAVYWTVLPLTIVDADASPTSAYAEVNPSATFTYAVNLLLSPVVGAFIRLDPARTVVVQVIAGVVTGSAQVTFTCAFAACNAVLQGLQLQANTAGTFNLSITATQEDTEVSASGWLLVTGAGAAAASTGSAEPVADGGAGGDETIAEIFAPTSKWFWVTIACGVGVLMAACAGWKWRRARRLREERSNEITSVAVELAKAVGSDKAATEAEVDARASLRAAETMSIIQAMTPRGGGGVDPFAATQPLPYALSPRAGMMVVPSPRGYGMVPGSPRSPLSPLSPRTPMYVQSPRGLMLVQGPEDGGTDAEAIQLQWEEDMYRQQQMVLQQQQQQQMYQHMLMTSPRRAPTPSLSPRPFNLPPPLTSPSRTGLDGVAGAMTAPAAGGQRRFTFLGTRPEREAGEREGEEEAGVRPRLSLTITPASASEVPIIPALERQ